MYQLRYTPLLRRWGDYNYEGRLVPLYRSKHEADILAPGATWNIESRAGINLASRHPRATTKNCSNFVRHLTDRRTREARLVIKPRIGLHVRLPLLFPDRGRS